MGAPAVITRNETARVTRVLKLMVNMGVRREGRRRKINFNPKFTTGTAFFVTVSSPLVPYNWFGRSNFFTIQKVENISKNTQEMTSLSTCVTRGEGSRKLANAEQIYRDA
jgi:hypothetical protein